MLKKILGGFAAVIVLLVGVIMMQPNTYRYERSATMNAPAMAIFEQVNNLQNWNSFSPWAKLDPEAKMTFEGPQAGEGAIIRWDGNKDVGAGSMTIAESRPHELVKFNLEFLKPFKDTSTAEFTFVPEGVTQTKVTWAMYGNSKFIGKAMGLVMDCEAMMGKYFEEGLANLKAIVEKGPAITKQAPPANTPPANVPPANYLGTQATETPAEEVPAVTTP